MTTDNKLSQAVQLIQAGNKLAALPLLKQVIQSEPNNESAWLWLYSCVDDIPQKKYCLKKVLEINPNNTDAHSALEKLSFIDTPIAQKKPAPAQEIIYYQKDPVLVTNRRIVFGGETHVLKNITSVSAVKLPPDKTLATIMMPIGIVSCLCGSMGSILFTGDEKLGGIASMIGGLGMLAVIAAIFAPMISKSRFAVKLVSGSGEITGYISKDEKEIGNIVKLINKAIIEQN